jgi:hypothetical protein
VAARWLVVVRVLPRVVVVQAFLLVEECEEVAREAFARLVLDAQQSHPLVAVVVLASVRLYFWFVERAASAEFPPPDWDQR